MNPNDPRYDVHIAVGPEAIDEQLKMDQEVCLLCGETRSDCGCRSTHPLEGQYKLVETDEELEVK